MARKIGILEHYQESSAAPATYVKRSVAALLLRRLLAVRISDHVIQRVKVKQADAMTVRMPIEIRRYVPAKMPPREIPGVFFQEPQSDTWKREHRTVTFMPRTFTARQTLG